MSRVAEPLMPGVAHGPSFIEARVASVNAWAPRPGGMRAANLIMYQGAVKPWVGINSPTSWRGQAASCWAGCAFSSGLRVTVAPWSAAS